MLVVVRKADFILLLQGCLLFATQRLHFIPNATFTSKIFIIIGFVHQN